MRFLVDVRISKQEDGIWRVEVPGLQGGWTDAPTIEEALRDLHEIVALMLDFDEAHDHPLPESIRPADTLPQAATILVDTSEHVIKRRAPRKRTSVRPAAVR
ncbi:MAG: type II toxin-antitoxin system HicB family antitoxin [Dehalococcoidia bacterium]|nr:type II toxin-antitoxin system HicB family antitoxin [Dehalococcoidia bacterium]